MPRNLDLNAAIRRMITQEVQASLGDYRALLEQLRSLAAGTPSVRRGPGRPPKAAVVARASAPRRARRAPAGADKDAVRLAKKFSEGQTVKYKQGRGEFEAKVKQVDAETGVLTLERSNDGKQVNRPASKVAAA